MSILDGESRVKYQYEVLKNTLDSEKIDFNKLRDSLCVFFRIALVEENTVWHKLLNKYSIDISFPILSGFRAVDIKKIDFLLYDESKKLCFLGLDDFKNLSIIFEDDVVISVRDFIKSLSYNFGNMHAQPDGPNKTLTDIYKLISKNEELVKKCLFEITKVLLVAYYNVYYLFKTNQKIGLTTNYGDQPQIFKNSKLITFYDSNWAAALFDNSSVQIPIEGKLGKGLRVSLDFELLKDEVCYLWSVNCKNKYSIELRIDNLKNLCININLRKYKHSFNLKRKFHVQRKYKIEAAFYYDGRIIVAIDELNIKTFQGPKIQFEDCKLILGADKNLKKFGSFKTSSQVIETINQNNVLESLGVYSCAMRIKYKSLQLPSDQLFRKLCF